MAHIQLGSWAQVERKGELIAPRVSPGVALGLYHPRKNAIYLAHSVDVSRGSAFNNALHAFLEDAVDNEDIDGSRAWLWGAATPFSESLHFAKENKQILNVRSGALLVLGGLGIHTEIQWNEPGEELTVGLRLNKGKAQPL